MKDLLDSGLYYIHGRDRSLRPITFFSPAVVLVKQFDINDAIIASHFVDQYMINYLMTPEKVENWNWVLDLGNLSFNSLPKKWILDFIKAFSHHYYSRARCNYMLNSSFAVRAIWNIVKVFVDPVTKSKMIIEGSNTHKSLQERVHPKQLQQQFGGEAPNVTVFWPPYSPSNEYGVDRAKIFDPRQSLNIQNEESKLLESESCKESESKNEEAVINNNEAVETQAAFNNENAPVGYQMGESPLRRSTQTTNKAQVINETSGPVSEKKNLKVKSGKKKWKRIFS